MGFFSSFIAKMAESSEPKEPSYEDIHVDRLFWRSKAVIGSVPIPRHAFVSCVYKERFYIIGGYGQGGVYLSDSWEWDCEKAEWRYFGAKNGLKVPVGWLLPPMHSAAFTLLGSSLYAFGGITQKGQHLDSLISLDLETQQWRVFAPNGPSPRSRWGSSLVTHGGLLYLFGGFGDSFFSDLWRFDPANDTWTEIQPLGVPPPRHYHTAVVWQDQLYIIGGYRGSTFTSDIWAYSFTTNRWLKLAGTNLLSNRRGHSCVLIPHRRSCIVFGGRDDKRRLNDVIEFNFDDATWSVLRSSGNVPDSRVFHSAFLFRNSMFSFGGLNIYNTNDMLEYVLEPDSQLPNFKSGLRIDFSSLWKSDFMSDIKFQFPSTHTDSSPIIIIPAHKIILFSASEHFRRLFAAGMRESSEPTIAIDDMSPETFSEVLHFIYTGRLNKLTTENVLDLLVAADKFLISDLTSYLELALDYILAEDNINNILTLTATLPSAQTTFQRCITYIRSHITGPSLSKCKRSLKKINSALYKELQVIHKEESDKANTRRLQQEEFLRVAKAKAVAAAHAANNLNIGISTATNSTSPPK